jgi:oligoendopeptidase F
MPPSQGSRRWTKFYGDLRERITGASVHLLFFTLELNRIDDALIEKALADPRFARYRPWIEDVRKEKPYQLEDRVEQLFHEKSVTGAGPGTGCSTRPFLRCASKSTASTGDRADAQPCCRTANEEKRKAAPTRWRRRSRKISALFALITNTLAKDKEISDRWRGFKDIADSRHLANRVEPEVVDALVQRCARPIRGCRIATTR